MMLVMFSSSRIPSINLLQYFHKDKPNKCSHNYKVAKIFSSVITDKWVMHSIQLYKYINYTASTLTMKNDSAFCQSKLYYSYNMVLKTDINICQMKIIKVIHI